MSLVSPDYWTLPRYFLPAFITDLRSGVVTISDGNHARWKGENPWIPNDPTPTNFFRLHSFGFIKQCAGALRSREREPLAELTQTVVDHWAEHFSTPDPEVPAWGSHQVALRSINLSLAVGAGLLDAERNKELFETHGEWLVDPEHYDGAWNHGLDQAIALLDLSAALSTEGYARVGVDRIAAASELYADEQGVVAEQATHYSAYIWRRLTDASQKIQMLTGSIPESLERTLLIPDFTRKATLPNGKPVPIGDTQRGNWKSETGIDSTASQPPEVSGLHTYRDGWLFIRDGYESGHIGERSHLTARYGTFRRIHGHRDHLSLTWVKGNDAVLCDPGFSSYSDSDVRFYEQMEHSHNGPRAEGMGRFLWQRGSRLTSATTHYVGAEATPAYSLGIINRGYAHGSRERQVLFLPSVETLVVVDRLHPHSPDATTNLQTHWQFAEGTSREGVTATPSGFEISLHTRTLFHHCLTADVQQDIAFGEHEPRRGWIATENATSVPAVALTQEVAGNATHLVNVFSLDPDVTATMTSAEGTVTITVTSRAEESYRADFTSAQPVALTSGDPFATDCFDHTD